MKKVEWIVKQELFDKIGVTIVQLHYNIDKNNDFHYVAARVPIVKN